MGLLAAGVAAGLQAQQPVQPAGPISAQAPATLAVTTNAAGPKIQFDNPIYEFGKITAGDLLKHTFFFTNTGDQVLELLASQCRKFGTTLMMATHSPLTCRFTDRILRIVDGVVVEDQSCPETQP